MSMSLEFDYAISAIFTNFINSFIDDTDSLINISNSIGTFTNTYS